MLDQDFLAQQRAILEDKLRRYLAPESGDQPVELELKRRDAVPYILRALKKHDLGTYGYCDDCEEAIPLARLELVPGACRCVECETRFSNARH